MKKYKNISGRSVGFIVNGKTLGFDSGEVRQFPDNFKEDLENMVSKIVPLEEPKKEVVKPKPTEEEIFKMNKKRQSEIIKSYGKKIPKLEKNRVKLIIKLQGE